MTPHELATLYLQQQRRHRDEESGDRSEANALFLWEELISEAPEEAWPVFEDILSRVSDDDTLEQVWYRLRLLLYRHYDAFHARVAGLFDRHERLRVIAGPKALDSDVYHDKRFDAEELIRAYRAMHRTHASSEDLKRLARSDPHRAFVIAIEIIHRGVARGWESFDVMSPLRDVLSVHAGKVAADVERSAKASIAVRRVLWRLKRQMRRSPTSGEEVWDRLEKAAGETTDYTEPEAPIPAPQQQLDADEAIIDAWFEHEESFWAFSALNDLCENDPRAAWSITLELIDRAEDEGEMGAVAAGPLEDLIRTHSGLIWNELEAKAHTDERFRSALGGVWIFPDDGDVFQRFTALMQELEAEP